MLEGIDVSDVQGIIDWQKVKDSGVAFAFCKATEGDTFVSKMFKRNWEGIKEAGLIRGAYHFGRTKNDPIKEAEHFVKTVNTIEPTDMLVLDIEDSKCTLNTEQFLAWTLNFLEHVEKLTNVTPILYTYGPYFDTRGGKPDMSWIKKLNRFPLWLAAYVTNPDMYVPAIWKGIGWTIWQRSGDIAAKGDSVLHVPGIKVVVDRNQYKGSAEELKEFAKKLHISPVVNPIDLIPIDLDLQKNVDVIDKLADAPLTVPNGFWDSLFQFLQKIFGIK